MERVDSIEALKRFAFRETGEYVDFCVILAGGLARSFKRMGYDPDTDTFGLYHMIDDTEQEDLDEDALATETVIVEAIEKGALYYCGE